MTSLSRSWLSQRMGWLSMGLVVLYWLLESMMDAFVYDLGPLSSRIFAPDLNETAMRLLAIVLLISFGFYAQTMFHKLYKAEDRVSKMNECFLSFGADPVENIRRLTELCGELIGASAAFYNRLDAGRLWSWGQWGECLKGDTDGPPEGRICFDVIRTKHQGTHLIRDLDRSPYAETDPRINQHGFKTYFGRVVRLGQEDVGSLCAFYDHDIVPKEEENRLMGIIASAIGVEEIRRRAQKHLESSQHQLRKLSAQLLSAQETERKQMAMQLHDSIGQSLSAVKFSIEESLESLSDLALTKKFDSLQAAVSIIQSVMNEVRAMQKTLRPAMLDDLGVLATIAWFCRDMETIYSGIKVKHRTDVDESQIPDNLKVVIFRILQEAVNNAMRHSQAALVSVELTRTQDRLELKIQDNGKGLDQSRNFGEEDGETGMGLSSMRERAELSGGRFSIESAPGAGTVVFTSWPMTSYARCSICDPPSAEYS
jgi:signal transduction histidine kinase